MAATSDFEPEQAVPPPISTRDTGDGLASLPPGELDMPDTTNLSLYSFSAEAGGNRVLWTTPFLRITAAPRVQLIFENGDNEVAKSQ